MEIHNYPTSKAAVERQFLRLKHMGQSANYPLISVKDCQSLLDKAVHDYHSRQKPALERRPPLNVRKRK